MRAGQLPGVLLAAAAPLGVLPVNQCMLSAGVHDEQPKTMGGQVEGHLAIEPSRQSSSSAWHALERSAADWSMPPVGARVMVFSTLTQIVASVPRALSSRRRSRFGEPCAQGHLAVHHEVKSLNVVAGLLQCPEDTSGVAAPAGRVAGPDIIEVQLVLLRRLQRSQPQSAVVARPHRGYVRCGRAIARHSPSL